MSYGQLVIGPPGSGKSTYCKTMAKFLTDIGRKVVVINIDPANDCLPYEAAINISELVTVQDVMTYKKLGPNGGLLYAMEYLEKNVDWLLKKLASFQKCYFLFDCPGQIELYSHHTSIKNIIARLQKTALNLCAVYLVDSHYCSDPGKFISALMITLSTMLNMEIPHLNILSKVDLMTKFADKLPFSLEYYTEVLDLQYILDYLQEDKFTSKYRKLNSSLVELIEGYGLVTFLPLNIKDKRLLVKVKNSCDKANGYVYNAREERNVQTLLACAVGAESEQDRIGINEEVYGPANPKCEQMDEN